MKIYSQEAFKKKTNRGVAKKVVQYSLDGELLAEYASINEASIATDCDQSAISRVCRGKFKQHGGFVWKYLQDGEQKKETE